MVGPQDYPVKWCRGWAETRTLLRVHFLYMHIRKTMVILEEGNPPHPWYSLYDMLVPWSALNGHHTTNAQCAKEEEQQQKRHRLAADDMRVITARAV